MQTIITIEELPAFIDRALMHVNDGVALARRRGLLAELPKEVQFDVTLVSKWQVPTLELVSRDLSTGEDTSKDNGESKSTQSGGSTQKGTRTSKSNTQGTSNDAHNSLNRTFTRSED